MMSNEAKVFGIDPGQERRYFRAYVDKGNHAPPARASDWYELVSVGLGNGGAIASGDDVEGAIALPDFDEDSVVVVVPWTPPLPLSSSATPEQIAAAQMMLSEGAWAKSAKSQNVKWAGEAIAAALGISLADHGATARITKLIDEWLHAEYLDQYDAEFVYPNGRKRMAPHIRSGPRGVLEPASIVTTT